MGGKKKYIEMFGSFTEQTRSARRPRLPPRQATSWSRKILTVGPIPQWLQIPFKKSRIWIVICSSTKTEWFSDAFHPLKIH